MQNEGVITELFENMIDEYLSKPKSWWRSINYKIYHYACMHIKRNDDQAMQNLSPPIKIQDGKLIEIENYLLHVMDYAMQSYLENNGNMLMAFCGHHQRSAQDYSDMVFSVVLLLALFEDRSATMLRISKKPIERRGFYEHRKIVQRRLTAI